MCTWCAYRSNARMCIRPIASSIPPLTRMAANKKGSENIHSTKSSRDTLVDGIIKMLRKCSASTCSMHVCMLVTLVVRRCRATKSTCRYTKTHSNTDSLSLSPLPPLAHPGLKLHSCKVLNFEPKTLLQHENIRIYASGTLQQATAMEDGCPLRPGERRAFTHRSKHFD